jgi:hypothetical protein
MFQLLKLPLLKKNNFGDMMKTVTVELDWDTVDNIVVSQLLDTYESLSHDCSNRKAGHGMAIFEADLEADVALIENHLAAFRTALSYFGHTIN